MLRDCHTWFLKEGDFEIDWDELEPKYAAIPASLRTGDSRSSLILFLSVTCVHLMVGFGCPLNQPNS